MKTLLVVSHGNSTPERDFRTNKAVLVKNRGSLDGKILEAIRIVKDKYIE